MISVLSILKLQGYQLKNKYFDGLKMKAGLLMSYKVLLFHETPAPKPFENGSSCSLGKWKPQTKCRMYISINTRVSYTDNTGSGFDSQSSTYLSCLQGGTDVNQLKGKHICKLQCTHDLKHEYPCIFKQIQKRPRTCNMPTNYRVHITVQITM